MVGMIDLHGDISIPFLKKSRFTGSYLGMRYQLMKAERPKNQMPPENGEEACRDGNGYPRCYLAGAF